MATLRGRLSLPARARVRAPSPALLFVVVSLLFGAAIVFVTPPLRGHDETAHFLRAYGIARGDLVPSTRDADGRKGIRLPARIHEDFAFFDRVQTQEKGPSWHGYGPVMRDYLARSAAAPPADAPPVFVPYAGSEGYSPLAYLPQTAGALVARALGLGFLPTLYLMRLCSLLAFTLLIAQVVARARGLAWPLLAIAMLPSALFARSIISADAGALAAALFVVVLWLRLLEPAARRLPVRWSGWLALSALTKPSNLALVALAVPWRDWSASRRRVAAAALPAVVLAASWTYWSGADTAAWRLVEITGDNPEVFDARVKLVYLLHEPLYFPAAVLGSWQETNFGELWSQVIGVLGLFDTVLQPWVYPVITALLLASFASPLGVAAPARARVIVAAALTIAAYVAGIYLIAYLSFTPLDAGTVWGVQGRYFVPALPLAAVIVGTMLERGLGDAVLAGVAVTLSVLSGCAAVDAILRTDWHL